MAEQPPPDPKEARIEETHNTARFFVEQRPVAWVVLLAAVAWGVWGYFRMPQRKDPEVPVRKAVVITPWFGASVEKVEQQITSRIEQTVAQNRQVSLVESVSRTGLSVVYVTLGDDVASTGEQFDDISLRLDTIKDLPQGAGSIQFIKDFGDTAALVLTIASPRADATRIALRARSVEQAIRRVRAGAQNAAARVTLLRLFPDTVSTHLVSAPLELFAHHLQSGRLAQDVRLIEQSGIVGVDILTHATDAQLLDAEQRFFAERLPGSDLPPDTWNAAVIRDPAETLAKLTVVAGDKYSYRELDDFTDQIQKTLQSLSQVARVTRAGLLEQQVSLLYSQERLAAYGVTPSNLTRLLGARNITAPGGQINADGSDVTIVPSGEFTDPGQIGDVAFTATPQGAPVYLRDLVDIERGYQSPPRYLNDYESRIGSGWQRNRAITLAIQMRTGEKIGNFGKAVASALQDVRKRLPSDLIYARTSDQPKQVTENISLFMHSLLEAILLVVIVSLIGFWEWRSALLMALSIPITLAMTFGAMSLLGVDLQQVSIATLIIALGLLVDDPVVAGDAIKRELAEGRPRGIAAWLGPTRLGTAILFATITNIVAYLPFLLLTGDVGQFLRTLPIVMTCALVASRLVSMTFIPLLAYYLLRPAKEKPMAERRKQGFTGFYVRVGTWAIAHRWGVLLGSLAVLGVGAICFLQLRQQFFPNDLSYLSYVDVWLPENATFAATDATTAQVEHVIETAAEQFKGAGKKGTPVLHSLTTFVGGGGPRFWFSVEPQLQLPNYAQVLIEVNNKWDTQPLVAHLQRALDTQIAGARVDVRQLETGKPVGVPIAIRLSGTDIPTLRALAEQAKTIFREAPSAVRVRDDWGTDSFTVHLETDPDRANLAGITNADVALASTAGFSGYPVSTLREGDKQIPIVARLRIEERARLSDLRNLYVYSSQGQQHVPLEQVASLKYEMALANLHRRNQFRTVTVSCFPAGGTLPSETLNAILPRLNAFARSLPPGYHMEIGGEHEEQVAGFQQLAVVLAISVAAIYLALVFQFRSGIKPFIVFAAIPYGISGALGALWLMRAPFGFMAFLGVVSLVGVIVSHIIVLFDFIEEAHAQGEPFQQALLDAGIARLRPVLITVAATVTALFPLAHNGGPLWEPLCFAQIGGLSIATFITLLLVPVLYSVFVLDFTTLPKIVDVLMSGFVR